MSYSNQNVEIFHDGNGSDDRFGVNFYYIEGLTDVIKQRKESGIYDQPAREEYSKHVKAVLQAGKKNTDHYGAKLDYPIEFVPEKNPYSIKVGKTLPFRLYRKGKALSDQVVHYAFRSQDGKTTKRTLRTDSKGRVEILYKRR